MWKTILSLAALVLSVGVSAHLIGTANATFASAVSTGYNPIQNYGGVHASSSTAPVLTAPDDHDLIVTGILTNNGCAIILGDTTIVPETSYFYPTYIHTRGGYDMPPSIFTTGDATLRVPAGETLSFDCTGSNTRYYIQGYLTQP